MSLLTLISSNKKYKIINSDGGIIISLYSKREFGNEQLYKNSHKPSTSLIEFCYVMDWLVHMLDEDIVHIELPALTSIIMEYILPNVTIQKGHNYAMLFNQKLPREDLRFIRKNTNRYLRVRENCKPKRLIHKHRVIMENFIGRSLSDEELVHHKNGIKSDNRIENLELWRKWHPVGQRVTDLIEWAEYFLRIYAPEKLKNVESDK